MRAAAVAACRAGAFASLCLLLIVVSVAGSRPAAGQSVLQYHGSPGRAGNFVASALTWERARNIRLDPEFHPRFSGHLYAQPL